ncbi:hypothetical protein V7S43_016427 [Phytophthora oleae]|uniref:Uncharacterized protein n=1 Tax=Phytophthora oleae TaxID=2107226 RepID=A0ABD3EVJ3_9STRA
MAPSDALRAQVITDEEAASEAVWTAIYELHSSHVRNHRLSPVMQTALVKLLEAKQARKKATHRADEEDMRCVLDSEKSLAKEN